jgi:4-hydroxy-2-oxoheptanedioate aldolase
MRPNLTKRKIRSGVPAFGIVISQASPGLVEVCAHAGFDYFLVDAEHAAVNEERYENLVRAAESTGMTPLVSVTSAVPEQIGRLLDIGMQGVVVTHVRSKADAVLAVRSAKYFPEGERGVGLSRAAGYGLKFAAGEYTKRANEETMIVAMIEDEEGARNLSEILTVDGIDVCFIGPSDLAHSLGLPGQTDHPRVQAMLSEISDEILRSGKALGIPGKDADKTACLLEQGATMVDVPLSSLVMKASREWLEQWSEHRSAS